MTKKKLEVSPEQMLSLYQNQRALLDSIEQQIQTAQAFLRETTMAEDALKEISESAKDKRVLFSVGAGVFIDTRLLDSKNVKAEIGGGAFKEMTIKKAMNRLDDRKEDIRKGLKKLAEREEKALASLKQMESAMAKFQQQLQQREKQVPSGVS